ncbi:uncharacterized protein LOC141720225 [Apium graveolens]|uniref:uncharacterized protein LOC141720225 n=1 Tax=Apium graveolens TaxID=4045 RepID=UPI003D79C518
MQRIKPNKIDRKAELMRADSWSELCSDLLGDIMGRLCPTDQARFRAVCKSWRHVYPIIKPHAVFKAEGLEGASLLSWFVQVDQRFRQSNSTLEVRLYAPCHSIHYPISVHTISLSELSIPTLYNHSHMKIFCKINWLFISIMNIEVARCPQMYFILFSPLTKTLKQLPPCSDPLLRHFELSFSSDPESADCVFILLDLSFYDKFIVSTCRKDDKEWTIRPFRKVQNFPTDVCKLMYTEGDFYIVSRYGKVASYNVIKKEINIESLSIDGCLGGNKALRLYNLFTMNGELMSIFNYGDISCTKRFDRVNKVWINVSSLHDSENIDDEKPHSAANMIEFSEYGCLIFCSRSFDVDLLVPCTKPRVVFGSEYRFCSNSFSWIKPPLIE